MWAVTAAQHRELHCHWLDEMVLKVENLWGTWGQVWAPHDWSSFSSPPPASSWEDCRESSGEERPDVGGEAILGGLLLLLESPVLSVTLAVSSPPLPWGPPCHCQHPGFHVPSTTK